MIRAYARKSTLGPYIVINIPSYGQLISMAGLSTLQHLRLQDIAILMYKIKHNMCPTYISTLFEQPASKYKLWDHDFTIQSTPDNSNLQGKSKKVQVIGSSSYREFEEYSCE